MVLIWKFLSVFLIRILGLVFIVTIGLYSQWNILGNKCLWCSSYVHVINHKW